MQETVQLRVQEGKEKQFYLNLFNMVTQGIDLPEPLYNIVECIDLDMDLFHKAYTIFTENGNDYKDLHMGIRKKLLKNSKNSADY